MVETATRHFTKTIAQESLAQEESQRHVDALEQAAAKQRTQMVDMQKRITILENERLRLQRRIAGFNQERTAAITFPITGEPDVQLQGRWGPRDFTRLHRSFMQAIKLNNIAMHADKTEQLKAEEPETEEVETEEVSPVVDDWKTSVEEANKVSEQEAGNATD